MKNTIIWLFTILISISLLSCTDNKDSDETNGLEEPYFEVNISNQSGFASETDPFTPIINIITTSITGDKPRSFEIDFGDNSEIIKTSDDYIHQHSYPNQGIYTAKITLTDNDKESYSEEIIFRVRSQVDFKVQTSSMDNLVISPGEGGTLHGKIVNLGNEKAKNESTVKVYLSLDQNWSDEDIEIGSETINEIEAGGIETVDINYIVPTDITPELYWVIVRADAENTYIEVNEADNYLTLLSQLEILGGDSRSPDLVVESIELPQYFIKDDPFSVNFKIKNQGRTTASPFSYKIALSEDQTLDDNDTILKYDYISSSLGPDDTHIQTSSIVINELGEYYLLFYLDPTNDIKETDEENNTYVSAKITVGTTLTGVDIIPLNITVSPSIPIQKGRSLSLSYSIRNRGDRPAIGSKVRYFFSKNQILDENDTLITPELESDSTIPTIGAGKTVDKSLSIVVPIDSSFDIGNYYLIVDLNYEEDGVRALEEVDYTNNNTYSREIEVIESQICTMDIGIENLQILPNPAFEGSPYTIKFNLTNNGTNTVTSFISKVFAGPLGTEILDNDTYMVKNYNIPLLAPESTQEKTVVTNLPNRLTSDQYCVTIHADVTSIIGECDEENNIITTCFTVTTRGNDNDITISDLNLSASSFKAGDSASASFIIHNTGRESEDAPSNTATFYCRGYFSPNETLDEKDTRLDEKVVVYNILEGESFEVTDFSFVVPTNMGDRDYRFFIKCDDDNIVPETEETNNTIKSDWVSVVQSTSGCNADSYERNDLSSIASDIPTANFTARLCDQDEDWYLLSALSATHKLRIDMTQLSGGNIDVKLYKSSDDGLVEIASSITTGNEVLEKNIINPEDEVDYYLHFFPKTASTFTKSDYEVQIKYEEVGGPGTDLLLRDVSIGTQNIKTGEAFNIYYTMENLRNNPTGNYQVVAYLSLDQRISDDDLILSVIPGDSLNILDFVSFDEELTLTENLPVGEYYFILKADPNDQITETDEENNTFIKRVSVNRTSTCTWDDFEPNGVTPLLSKIIGNGTYENLFVCNSDMDVYLVYLTKNRQFKAIATFDDDNEGNIDLYLYSPGTTDITSSYTNVVADSDGYTDTETITYTPTSTGFYILKVYKSSSTYSGITNQPYTLQLTGITDGYNLKTTEMSVLQSFLEANEDFDVVYDLKSVSTRDITLPFTYDFYLSTDALVSDDDRLVYRENITYFAMDESIQKQSRITLPSDIATASYYLIGKIDGTNQIAEYDETDNQIRKRISISGQCLPDYFESNNTIDDAESNAVVSIGRYNNLSICPSDIDYYAIPLNAGDKLFAYIYFTHNQGDLDLRLYGTDGVTSLANSNSLTDNEDIQYVAPNSGIYYLRVRGNTASPVANTYDLEILIPDCSQVTCEHGSCDIDGTGRPYCICDDGYLQNPDNQLECYDDPCSPSPCGEYADCSISATFEAVCNCHSDAHLDGDSGLCISDERLMECDELATAPEHISWDSDNLDGYFTQIWNSELSSWEPETKVCTFSCEIGYTNHPNCDICADEYHLEAGLCVSNTKLTQCDNYNSVPQHIVWDAGNSDGYYTQNWDIDNQAWTPEEYVCTYHCEVGNTGDQCDQCEEGYIADESGSCYKELILNGSFEAETTEEDPIPFWKGIKTTLTDSTLIEEVGNETNHVVSLKNSTSAPKYFSTEALSIIGNKTYSCSAKVKGKGNFRMGYILTSTSTVITGVSNSLDTTEWTTINYSFTPESDSDSFEFLFDVRLTTNAENIINVDNVTCRFK
ncbi:pre-peptidase C-terminal domain-containing protein [bacterium]|nr:pre-peptidase C-terminal domain-containing protein [bacterium]